MSFDEFGNVVGNIYIRKVEKKDGKYVNAIVKTYPNVSQFWTYDKEEFLKKPVLLARLPAGEEFGVIIPCPARGAARERCTADAGPPNARGPLRRSRGLQRITSCMRRARDTTALAQGS